MISVAPRGEGRAVEERGPFEVGVLRGFLGDGCLGLFDQLGGFVFLAEDLTDDLGVLLPRAGSERPIHVPNGRGDLAEPLVLCLGEAGVHADDDVRLEGQDLLVVRAVLGHVDDLRHLRAQLVLDLVTEPRGEALLVAAPRLGNADRNDAERGDDVVVHPTQRHHALRFLRNRRVAQRVFDRARVTRFRRGRPVGGCARVGRGRAAGGQKDRCDECDERAGAT